MFVAVEGAEVEAEVNAGFEPEFGPDFVLGIFESFGAEDVVDVGELVAVEGGEFGEGLEGAGAVAFGGMGWGRRRRRV